MSSDVYRAECAVVCVTAVVSALLNSTLNALISFVAITHLILTPFKTVQKTVFKTVFPCFPERKPSDNRRTVIPAVCVPSVLHLYFVRSKLIYSGNILKKF